MADRPYLPLVAGMELVRRSGNLTQFPPDYLLGNLPTPPEGELRFNIPVVEGTEGFAHAGSVYGTGDESAFVTLSSLGDVWYPVAALAFTYVVLYKEGASIEDQPTWELTQGTGTLLSWQDIVDLGATEITGMVPGASVLTGVYPRDGVDGAAQGDLRLLVEGQTLEFRFRWATWRSEWNAFSALNRCLLGGSGIQCPNLIDYTLPEDFGFRTYLGEGAEMSPADTTWTPYPGSGVRLCYLSVNTTIHMSFGGVNADIYEVGWGTADTEPLVWGPIAAAQVVTNDTTCNQLVSTELGTRVQTGDTAFTFATAVFWIRLKDAAGAPGTSFPVTINPGFRYTAH